MKKKIYFAVLLSLVLLVNACKKGHCPADMMLDYPQVIKAYHQNVTKKDNFVNQETKFAVYLDYSSSMKTAFADKKTLDFYEMFINSLKISTVDFYEVDKNNVTEIKNLNKNELYKKVKDVARFSGINAPLHQAMQLIMTNKCEAVFITDGELWDNGEKDDPWAREEFELWLTNGNLIDFYVTDHIDEGKQKHVFYMFFIPKNKIDDTQNISNQFKFYLDNSLTAKELVYSKFSFSNNAIKLTQEYKTQKSGGLNPNAILNEETYINEGLNYSFEYIDIMMRWKDIVKYIQFATNDMGQPLKNGEPLINQLFVETTNLEFYKIEELGIKVYDAKNDVDKLKAIYEALQNPPSFVKDAEDKIVLDADNKPMLDCPGQTDAYSTTGELILDTNFVSNNLTEINDLFVFDNEAFMNNFKQQGRGEIVIKISENFDGSQISETQENLFKIDIYLKKVTPYVENPNLAKFIWQGKQVESNKSIYNSILGALNAANPQGQVIYTFYIKTLSFK